jgi:hypothetical protein
MILSRHVLIPHKVSIDDIFGDESHIIINRGFIGQSPHCLTNSMSLSDFNHNQYHLNEVESVQLLSSLVIRSIQVQKQYERILPEALSPLPLRTSLNRSFSSKLPSLGSQRPTTRQLARIHSTVQAKATREGRNFLST